MNPKSQSVLSTLRRIIRAIDLHEKELSRSSGLTLPQLLTLQTLQAEPLISTGVLAQRMNLAQATVTSILDRLENKGLVGRIRGTDDKRKVWVQLTEEGRARLLQAPNTLQGRFLGGFEELREWEQSMLIGSLELVATLLEAPEADTAPMLDGGELTRIGD
jgi:DNA-binding MarR family transcriptional regulator